MSGDRFPARASRLMSRRCLLPGLTMLVVLSATHAGVARQVAPQAVPPPRLADPLVAPSVSIWYRGDPAGTPNLDDLAELRALGFSKITWPGSLSRGIVAVGRLAAEVGMTVDIRAAAPLLTAGDPIAPGASVDIAVSPAEAILAPALAWRAIARGARRVYFDAGESSGQGWRDQTGAVRPWLADARTIARQFEFNAELIRAFGRTMTMSLEAEAPPGVDVSLIDADRSWVLVATNVSRQPARGAGRLPRGVPPAPWADLFDGEVMAMLDLPDGPRWTFELGPGQARVFAINRRIR